MAKESKTADDLDEVFNTLTLFNHCNINPIYSLISILNKTHGFLLPEFEKTFAKFISDNSLDYNIVKASSNIEEVKTEINKDMVVFQVQKLRNALIELKKFLGTVPLSKLQKMNEMDINLFKLANKNFDKAYIKSFSAVILKAAVNNSSALYLVLDSFSKDLIFTVKIASIYDMRNVKFHTLLRKRCNKSFGDHSIKISSISIVLRL